ncbi:MAG: AmmeMemoRadiSam system radical SAM enzyme [Candidatus Omnitrophota bacterium]
MKEALLYEKLENKLVRCFLCAHQCRIPDTKYGFCGVRQNLDGTLYTHVYGKPITLHIDPIEKKPLYHFLPGTFSFSLATVGCNFHCGFCQNWEISQTTARDGVRFPEEDVFPGEIVENALKNECRSISYTYTEPTIFFEYALDIAKLAKEKGLYNVFVTNGYMTKDALEMIRPFLDAANVDLKFFREDSYRRVCTASLEPVKDTIRLMRELGIWVEVTTLVVPGENDSKEELGDIANFLASVDKGMPWHISRFHPDYKFTDHKATPEETLKMAQGLGKAAGIKYIYAGNVSGWGNDTYCPACGKALIKREGFEVLMNKVKQGKCGFCQVQIAGVFD